MPTQNDLHVDGLLSNVSVAFMQQTNAFVASRVFPDVAVNKQSDLYAVFPAADFNRDEMQVRADATESAGGEFRLSDDNYFAKVYAFHKDVGDQARANADSIFALDQNVTQYLSMKALLKKENLFTSTYFKAGVWSDDQTGVAAAPGANEFLQWNDASSDPIKDITDAGTRQQILTGWRPNVLVIGREVFDVLKLHPDVIDRVKYGTQTDVSIATKTHLAALFEVEEILVMEAIQNTAKEGQAASNSFIGGKGALLVYRTNTPGTMTPTAGYTFSWSGLVGTAGLGTRMNKFRMDHLKADRLEIEMAFDQKVVAADMGTFFATAVA